MMKYYLSNKPR